LRGSPSRGGTLYDGPVAADAASEVLSRPLPDPRKRDFGRLWTARAVSDLGSAVTMIALPLVAVVTLDASASQVAMVAAVASLAGALGALPLGTRAEYRLKRPAMVTADLLRAAGLASVPIAAAAGILTMAQIGAVALLTACASIVFNAASQSHLKSLVGHDQLPLATGRLESTLWFANLAGPPLGGAIAGMIGATTTLLVDAASFIASAIFIRRIRTPEPVPPARAATPRRDLATGWRFLAGDRILRRCLASYTIFSGTIMLMSPLETVFMIRDLHAQPWQYGLTLGLPCAAGLAGARLAPRLLARSSPLRVASVAAALRAPWMLVFPFATPGTGGLILVGVMTAGLLGFSAIHNTALTTYRLQTTPDHLQTRAATAWSVTVRSTQPLFIAAGAVLAATVGVRGGLWIAATVMALSAFLLPTGSCQSAPSS
jgi:predicted MFS family arabinose efflux permease